MLRRTQTWSSTGSMRTRKKFPYMVSHHKLPWNVVEAGSENAHKVLALKLLPVFEWAATRPVVTSRQHALGAAAWGPEWELDCVHAGHAPFKPDQWLFRLPGTTYIMPLGADRATLPLVEAAEKPTTTTSTTSSASSTSSSTSSDAELAAAASAAAAAVNANSATSLAPYGWDGKPVTDELALAHYGPLCKAVGPVTDVAEYRSPNLRIVCNAVRVAVPPGEHPMARVLARSPLGFAAAAHQKPFEAFCLFHFFRPNRSAHEMKAAFDKFAPTPRPNLTALTASVAQGTQFRPKLFRNKKMTRKGAVPPVRKGPVPSSPLYGLPEREAVRPGDTFGTRSRMWGHHW